MKTIIEDKIKELKSELNNIKTGSKYLTAAEKFTKQIIQEDIDLLQSILEEATKTKEDSKKTVYNTGQRVIIDKEEYILVRVEKEKVCLIGLENGNRWDNPIEVKDSSSITEEEMKALTANEKFSLK